MIARHLLFLVVLTAEEKASKMSERGLCKREQPTGTAARFVSYSHYILHMYNAHFLLPRSCKRIIPYIIWPWEYDGSFYKAASVHSQPWLKSWRRWVAAAEENYMDNSLFFLIASTTCLEYAYKASAWLSCYLSALFFFLHQHRRQTEHYNNNNNHIITIFTICLGHSINLLQNNTGPKSNHLNSPKVSSYQESQGFVKLRWSI